MNKTINNLIANVQCFSEKSREITPSAFTAFGIPIESRYGKIWEISEMMIFARTAACYSVAHYVESLFYDSKSGLCSIELNENALLDNEIQKTVHLVAKTTISLFILLDQIDGRNCGDDPP